MSASDVGGYMMGFSVSKLTLTMWLAVMLSGLWVVYISHKCRLLYNELALLEQEKHQLEVEWGQYLLEESSLASMQRVEMLAREELGMKAPTLDKVIMVRP